MLHLRHISSLFNLQFWLIYICIRLFVYIFVLILRQPVDLCCCRYCTGGIRCEMASAYIRSKGAGFENVFQVGVYMNCFW